MRTPHPTLTPQELAIMKEVWRLDKATVRDVYEALREKRSIAYTTVMTMMKILEDKGYLKKSQVDRAYVYRPARPRQQVVGAMVRDFVDRVFDGAAGGLLLHLARDGRLSKEDRQRIRLVIQETERPAREQDAERPDRKTGKED
jgi:predicted transcriptional regulator